MQRRCYKCSSKVYPHNFDARSPVHNDSKIEDRATDIFSKVEEVRINTCGTQSKSAIFGWEAIARIPVLYDTGAAVSVISRVHCGVIDDCNLCLKAACF